MDNKARLNMSVNLFIVESPFQLLSAIEARKYFNNEPALLFIRYSSESNNNKQIENILGLFEWPNIIRVNHHSLKAFVAINILLVIRSIKKEYGQFNKIFVSYYGGYQRYFLSNLRKQQVFLIDDGAYTYSIQKNILSKGNPYPFKDGVLKKMAFKLCQRYSKIKR